MANQANPLRIGIWCAVSTPEQATIEKDSLPSQERDGRSWAEGEGMDGKGLQGSGHGEDREVIRIESG